MSKDKQTNDEIWKTGDLVLCKVGSFPPWPAVVFPQRFLRNDVYKKKRSGRIAVCFFNDPTYYWEQPHRLNPLTSQIIKDKLSGNHNGMSDALVIAYEEAKKYYDLETFIKNRFIQENRVDDFNYEIAINGAISDGEDPLLIKEQVVKQQTKANTKTKTNGKSKINSKPLKQEDEKIKLDEEPSEFKIKHKISKGHSKLDRSRQIEIALLFRRRIQANLIQRNEPPTASGIEECHKLLSKIYENLDTDPPFFDLNTLRKSKLHKLLKVIVNDYNLEQFHQICKDILSHWTTMILQLKKEKEKAKENGEVIPKTAV
ncbi:hypothetical protein MOUN0_F04236 [Monosporozyma unispora]|nr:hypothetical protein C6P44_002773 [Kazachstania unispora]